MQAREPDIQVSVQIMTFHRDAGLRRAVASVLAQRHVDPATVEILLVDNSAEAGARRTATFLGEEAARAGYRLRYVHEPRPGIARARNAGVRQSGADLIAYIDDDEEADPDWLATMMAAMKRLDADAIGGPVLPIFEDESARGDPFWAWIFDYDERLPTGSTYRATGTGNCLFSKARCGVSDEPFDPALGLTGGSDTRFLQNLIKGGRRVLWCAEAVVHEYVPADRTRLSYGLRRRMRQSQLFMQTFSWTDPPDHRSIAKWMVIGALQMIVYAPLGIIFWPFDRVRARRYLALAYGGRGKVFWKPRFTAFAYGQRMRAKTAKVPLAASS